MKLEISGTVVKYVAKHSLYYLLLTTYVATIQLLSIFDGNHYVMGMLYECWRQKQVIVGIKLPNRMYVAMFVCIAKGT